jgi:hypothetical protein
VAGRPRASRVFGAARSGRPVEEERRGRRGEETRHDARRRRSAAARVQARPSPSRPRARAGRVDAAPPGSTAQRVVLESGDFFFLFRDPAVPWRGGNPRDLLTAWTGRFSPEDGSIWRRSMEMPRRVQSTGNRRILGGRARISIRGLSAAEGSGATSKDGGDDYGMELNRVKRQGCSMSRFARRGACMVIDAPSILARS